MSKYPPPNPNSKKGAKKPTIEYAQADIDSSLSTRRNRTDHAIPPIKGRENPAMISSMKLTSRKRRDHNAPKQAACAYVFFAKDERSTVRKEHPDMNFTQISKLLGQRWRNLSPDQKSKYECMASDDRERLRKELIAYKQSQAMPQTLKKNKGAKDNEYIQGHTPLAYDQTHPEAQYSDEFCAGIIKQLSDEYS